jgi:predicted glycoside hydrolase/deacetylase ChbG (UPF0249 family)
MPTQRDKRQRIPEETRQSAKAQAETFRAQLKKLAEQLDPEGKLSETHHLVHLAEAIPTLVAALVDKAD